VRVRRVHGLHIVSRLTLVSEKFLPIIGITEILHLQPLVLLQEAQQQTNLVLEVVEVCDGTVGQVGRLQDETLRQNRRAGDD